MKSFEKELTKYTAKVRLKVSERHELRERIISYMEYHPLPKEAKGVMERELNDAIQSQPFFVFEFSKVHGKIFAGAFAFILVVSPFIAERSVPGDILYAVKTGINEPFQKQLVSTPYEKIEFETKLMERRISEARQLAETGQLTDEFKVQLAESVKEHTTAVQEGIQKLKVQDSEGAAIAQIVFTSSLEVQSAVLNAESDSSDTSLIEAVKIAVNEARQEMAVTNVENKPSFDGLAAKIESETTRAYELFAAVKQSATADEVADIERRFSDLNRLIGDAKIKQEKSSVAVTQATDALFTTTMVGAEGGVASSTTEDSGAEDLAYILGLIQKLIVFMTDIDVRETIALDVLLPVVLSDEERLIAWSAKSTALTNTTEAILQKLSEIDDEGVIERVNQGILKITELHEAGELARDAKDLTLAESLLTEAYTFADDLTSLLQHDYSVVPDTTADTLPIDVSTSTDTIATTTVSTGTE